MPPYCRNLLPAGLVCFLLVPNSIFASNDVSISKRVVDDDAAAAGGSSLHLVDEDKTYWGREIRKLYNQMMSMPPESKISVDISCSTANEDEEEQGTSCDDLRPPESTECKAGSYHDSSPNTLKFTYIGGSCEQSSTTQKDTFQCEDIDGGPSMIPSVHLECTSNDDDTSGMVIYDNEVTIGMSFSLEGGDSPLPGSIQCRVKDAKDHTLQIMTIGLMDELNVKDVFGSLRLENCDSVGCLVEIFYLLTISNDGNTHLEITSVELASNGKRDNILDDVPDTSLDAGEKTQTRQSNNLDICISGTVQTEVEVIAKPPTGSPISSNVVNLIVEVPGFPQHESDDKPCSTGGKKGGKKGRSSDCGKEQDIETVYKDDDEYEYVGKGGAGKGKGGKDEPDTENDDEEETDDEYVGKGGKGHDPEEEDEVIGKGGKKSTGGKKEANGKKNSSGKKNSGGKKSSSGKKGHEHGKGGKRRHLRRLETLQV